MAEQANLPLPAQAGVQTEMSEERIVSLVHVWVGLYHLALEFGWRWDAENMRWLRPEEARLQDARLQDGQGQAEASELRVGLGEPAAGLGRPVPPRLSFVTCAPSSTRSAEAGVSDALGLGDGAPSHAAKE